MALARIPTQANRSGDGSDANSSPSGRTRSIQPSALPPNCSLDGATLTARGATSETVLYLGIVCGILAAGAYYSSAIAATGSFAAVFFIALPLLVCVAFWHLSIWRGYRFDLRRRIYEQTVFAFPAFQRRSLDIDDIAGIFAYADGIWLVRRSRPKRTVKLAQVGSRVRIKTAEMWAMNLGQALDVPFGCEFLAQFPQRNPRYARYDSEQIAFRKHPLRRLVAAVFSKAFALASLVVSGALTFVVVRHVYLPVHFSPTTNSNSIALSAIALLMLYAAGPQDVAFDLRNCTYTLSTGLLYFSRTRTGSIEADLSYITVLTNKADRTSSEYASTGQTHYIMLCWKNGSKTPAGSFSSEGEANAHALRLAADLANACGTEPARFRLFG